MHLSSKSYKRHLFSPQPLGIWNSLESCFYPAKDSIDRIDAVSTTVTGDIRNR